MEKNAPRLLDVGLGLSVMMGLVTIASWNTKSRPKDASRGTLGFNYQTKSLEYWDGTAWWGAPLGQN